MWKRPIPRLVRPIHHSQRRKKQKIYEGANYNKPKLQNRDELPSRRLVSHFPGFRQYSIGFFWHLVHWLSIAFRCLIFACS